MKTKISLVFMFFVSLGIVQAQQTENNNSFHNTEIQFQPRQLILPASLICIGTVGICNSWLQSVNHTVYDEMVCLRGGRSLHFDDYMQYLPVISSLGLGLTGLKARHHFKERMIVVATSYLAMGIMVNTIKLTVNVRRPDSSARNSFPSGHTATAFMGAELVRREYGGWYGAGAYTIACGVAFMRLYNDRHWLNDVLAGAGIGILSAQIGYWLLPAGRKLFRLPDSNTTTAISAYPFYDYSRNATGVALALKF